MPQREYDWSDINDPPQIEPHSVNKHQVILAYLQRYLSKLYSKAHSYCRLSIIDGFCGGGLYRSTIDGSLYFGAPTQLIEAVAQAQVSLPERYRKQVEIRPRYYFIDKDPAAILMLNAVLEQKGLKGVIGDRGGLYTGTFAQHCPTLLNRIKSEGKTHKAIFLLDQYGFTHVSAANLQSIFKELPEAEVILTFAVDWLIDYLTDDPTRRAACQRHLDDLQLGLTVEQLKAEKERPEGRWLIQEILAEQLSRSCGAKYFTRYFIKPPRSATRDSHRSLWLVHMSMHPVARDEMLNVHWECANQLVTHAGWNGIDPTGWQVLGYSGKADNRHGQLNMNFGFGNAQDRQSAVIQAHNDLGRLTRVEGRTPLHHLVGRIANYTLADKALLQEALTDHMRTGDIVVMSADERTKRRSSNAIGWQDKLIWQGSLFSLPKRH